MKKNLIFSFFTILLALLILFLLTGREHYVIGSGLNLFWFPLLILAVLLTILSFRINSHRAIKAALFFMCAMIMLEVSHSKIQEHRLKINKAKMINQEISLLSYNLYFRNRKPEVIIKQIQKFQPDIIVFQEVTPQLHKVLQKSLPYPYTAGKPLKGTHGLEIYSKYPISNIRYVNNSNGRPVAQFCQVTINNKTVAISNVHLASPAGAVQSVAHFKKYYKRNYYRRKKQYKEVTDYFKSHYSSCESRIIAGDLNTMRIEPLYKTIRKEWVDSFKKKGKGRGASFPNNQYVPWPYITIDYILIRGNIMPVKSQMLTGSSDHLGILSKLKI